MSSLSVSPELFRKSCARFATGIAVATVSSRDGHPLGMTVNSFTSVSCSPPLVLVCVDYRCTLLAEFRSSTYFGINVLSENQRDLSVRFSRSEGDRFDGIEWSRGDLGVPMLSGCIAAFECSVSQVVECGDHAIFIGEVARAEYLEGEPLIFFGSAYRRLTHTR